MITPTTSELPHDSEWWFGYEGFAPSAEGRREALCALGNGVFATRGSTPESTAGADHYPGTYAAGFYNRLVSQVEGQEVEHESMVNLPDWLALSFRPVGGDWLDLSAMHVAGYDQHLDLRRGILHRSFTVTDTEGRTTRLTERRLVHMATPHLAALEWTITPLDWSGSMEIRSGVDGSVENRNVAAELDLASRHLTDLETGTDAFETVWVSARTTQSTAARDRRRPNPAARRRRPGGTRGPHP